MEIQYAPVYCSLLYLFSMGLFNFGARQRQLHVSEGETEENERACPIVITEGMSNRDH